MKNSGWLTREHTPLEQKIFSAGYDLSELRAVATQAYLAQENVRRTMGRYPVSLSEFTETYGRSLLKLIAIRAIRKTKRKGGVNHYQFTPDGTEFAGRINNSHTKIERKSSPSFSMAMKLTRIAVGTQASRKKNK